jgi:aminopeptidase N
VTQFQESAARQAFPCLDHPRYKATVDLCMIVPQDAGVISNTPVAAEAPLANGLRRVSFETTPKMSTYLVFFAVGPFEWFHGGEDTRVHLAALPGLGHTTELGLTFGQQALAFCEAYYGIPYPLAKLDLIAIPDFAFGAMENWGAITFRENLLLHFTAATSAEGVERICEVIAHEIAHQWFGNLVTPEEWKYLWLNESFATYFGYRVVAHVHPEWEIWDRFLQTETASALSRDGLKTTIPIEMPGEDKVAINSGTAPIIYNKGASMLRMIEGYIGPDGYQKGVRTFLERHAYDCARSRHLWEAFEAATDMPVTAMVRNWVGQPGHPLVTVKREGDTLSMSQQRFSYLPMESNQRWHIPLTLTTFDSEGEESRRSLLLEEETGTVTLPAGTVAYKLNSGQSGFYRVACDDEENMAQLESRVADGRLPREDRWGLQNDLYALVRAGLRTVEEYLAFIVYYRDEAACLPLLSICGNLWQAYGVVEGPLRKQVGQAGAELIRRSLDRIGPVPGPEASHPRATLRNRLIGRSAVWEETETAAFAEETFRGMMAGTPAPAEIAGGVMQSGARLCGREALDWLKTRFVASPNEHERLEILMAMGTFAEWELVEEALAFSLTSVPPRNRFLPIAAAADNPSATPRMWAWYREHLEQLEAFHPLLYERVITGILPLGGLGNEEAVFTFFNDYLKKRPELRDATDLALENLEINQRMREKQLVG